VWHGVVNGTTEYVCVREDMGEMQWFVYGGGDGFVMVGT